MKILSGSLLIFFAFLHSGNARADRSIREISTTKIILMGTPLEDRATGENIALACTSFDAQDVKSCRTMQFAIFRGQSAFLFGPELIVQNPEHLQKELKETYKKLKKMVKQNRKTYWGGTVGFVLTTIGAMTGVIFLSIATGGSTLIFVVGAVAAIGGAGYLDHQRGLFDFVAGAQNLMSGKQLDATRTAEGWNWSASTRKISHRKFYHFKRAIDRMNESFGLSLTPTFTPAQPGQCRLNYSTYNQNVEYAEERMIEMSKILIAHELAIKYGCALNIFDRRAEYQLSITESQNMRQLILKNAKGEIVENASTPMKNNDAKDDQRMQEIIE